MANSSQFAARKFFPRAKLLLSLLTLLALPASARAQLIFDVFAGHGLGLADSTVTEASWFPVTCEIQNDGPSFNAIVELSGGQFGNGQSRRIAVELPTHTKKRFTVPVYCSGRYRVTVDARLLNEKGKVISERLGIEARTVVDWQSPLLASLSRTHSGAATFPSSDNRNTTLRPATTHLSPDLFPDNPLTLESITSIYLHSSRAVELKVPQVNALLAWVHNGGHLILGVEQPGDVNGAPWLKGFLPCALGEVTLRKEHAALQDWLQTVRSDEVLFNKGRIGVRRPNQGNQPQSIANPFKALSGDGAFESAELPAVSAVVRDGSVLIGTENAPLAIQAMRGRGQVTVLLFSPELEPFRSWKNRNWFWAKLGDVPLEWLANANVQNSGSGSLDAVFGAMVDSKQIRKLPVGWLLLLLLAYLIVIGPLDQYWLKKINKQMLTWVTFPTYVVLFSLLIYFIGYRLRSGEMEWNELHVVDVTPHGDRSDLRGRVYCSAYSPANARYAVASDAGYSTLRGEVGQAGAETSKASVEQRGNGFAAQLTVPVWTSQLFVNDWWKQSVTPLNFTVTERGDRFDVKIENPLGKKIPQARLIVDGRLYELGDVTKGATKQIYRASGNLLQTFVQGQVGQFHNAVNQRQQQFGAQEGGHLQDPFAATTGASFLAMANMGTDPNQNQNNYWTRFLTPPGFDLTPLMQRGDAILLAWMPEETIVPTLNQFSPRYSRKDTILRVVAPIGK
jgi:hypothetical protein